MPVTLVFILLIVILILLIQLKSDFNSKIKELELQYQGDVHWNGLTVLITGAYNYLFLAAVLYISRNAAVPFRVIALMLSMVALLAFPVLYNSRIIDIRNDYLEGGAPLSYFLVHYGLVAALFAMLYQAYRTVLSLGRRGSLHISQ